MKKTILVSSLFIAVFSITAYGFVNIKNQNKSHKGHCQAPDMIDQALLDAAIEKQATPFVYNIDSRFRTTITKSDFDNASTIYDIFPKEATEDKKTFNENKLVFLADGGNIHAYGEGINFSEEQKQLIQRMDYSDNFYLHVDCSYKFGEAGYTNEEYIIYYFTIIPETQAEYKSGSTALLDYIKSNNKELTRSLNPDKLRPGTIGFTVNTDGEIEKVELENTCGYTNVDKRLM
ncbi:MAG: hypothetical protein HKN09_13805, partial [Saprospiraceae bacterium]|nr:hypothetical protein [Saprospiraceae bacterium]